MGAMGAATRGTGGTMSGMISISPESVGVVSDSVSTASGTVCVTWVGVGTTSVGLAQLQSLWMVPSYRPR